VIVAESTSVAVRVKVAESVSVTVTVAESVSVCVTVAVAASISNDKVNHYSIIITPRVGISSQNEWRI
jgi:hypothetical protein